MDGCFQYIKQVMIPAPLQTLQLGPHIVQNYAIQGMKWVEKPFSHTKF